MAQVMENTKGEASNSSSSLTMKEKAKALMELGRLKFLAYSPIMYTIGAIISCLCDEKPFRIKEYFVGIGIVYGLHSMTHFFNEYVDYDTDVINAAASPWTGGSQVLVKGLLPRKTALYAGLFLITMVAMLVLFSFQFLDYHLYAVYVVLLEMLLAGQYSLPPIRASRRCMGELWVTIVLNFMCPFKAYLLQHGDTSSSPFPSHVFWKCLIPIGIVEYVRMMVMNMNDMTADAAVNKITVPVYLGLDLSTKVHNIGMALGYTALLVIYYWFNEDSTGIPTMVMLLLCCTAPYAYHYSRLLHNRPFRYELPFYASQHNCACMLAVYLGLLIDGLVVHPKHSDFIGLLFTKQYAIAMFFPLLILIPSLPILFSNIKRTKFE